MDIDAAQSLTELTIPQLLRWRTRQSGGKTALREKDLGRWVSYSWRDYYEGVRKAALGLRQIGFQKDDKLALITDNIPEMLMVAVGAQANGGVSAGIYQSSLPDEIASILDYLDVSVVFCDDQEQVDKLIEVRDRIPKVRCVLYEDPRGMRGYRSDAWFMFIDELYGRGQRLHASEPELFEWLVDQGRPDDVCHLCLTSGTTGLPKGAMLTHRNYINMGVQLTRVDPLQEGDEYVSFLPFAWIGEQMNSFGVALAAGVTINFPEAVETAMENLAEIGPHFMFGAPRIYETLRSQIWLKIDESQWFNRKLYSYFMKIGEKAARYRMSGSRMPPGLRVQAWLGKMLVFLPLINQIGMLRMRRAYTGGAALGPDLFTFYQAMGVNLKQIYGQTEIVGIAYMHRDGDVRPDTVGLPLPETQCKISPSGEILSRSPSATIGYYKMPDKTAELLEDGWLHSGDAGLIDASGHLVVIDRLADVMHTRRGDMFSPMFLENKLKFSPYIKEAVIFGDRQEYVAALINIDPIVVGKWAEDHGLSYTTFMDLSSKEKIADLIQDEIVKINATAEKTYFKIRRFAILPKLLDVDDGELTKTGKLRRKFIREKYADLHEALYNLKTDRIQVQTRFQYQDGQSTTVQSDMQFHTLE